MFLAEQHRMSADVGALDLWCNKCGMHVAHDLVVRTDNEVTRTLAGGYRDQNRVIGIVAECSEGHRQTVL